MYLRKQNTDKIKKNKKEHQKTKRTPTQLLCEAVKTVESGNWTVVFLKGKSEVNKVWLYT